VPLQIGDTSPKCVHFRAQLSLGALPETIGDQQGTVQTQPLDEEDTLGRPAHEVPVLALEYVFREIVAERVEQRDVGWVRLVPVTSLVFVAPGAAIDNVVVGIAAVMGTGAVVVCGQGRPYVLFRHSAIAASARIALAKVLHDLFPPTGWSGAPGQLLPAEATKPLRKRRPAGPQTIQVRAGLGKQLLMSGCDLLQLG
jgi:hypothetical protein